MTFDLLPMILQYEMEVYSTHQYEYLFIHMATDSNTQDSGYGMFDFRADNEPSQSFTVPGPGEGPYYGLLLIESANYIQGLVIKNP